MYYYEDSQNEFVVNASEDYIFISMNFPTEDDAIAFRQQLPKSAKFGRGNTIGDRKDGQWVVRGHISQRIHLRADGVNGGKNETGIKRYRTIRKAAEKLGVTVVFRTDHPLTGKVNSSLLTEEQLEEVLAL